MEYGKSTDASRKNYLNFILIIDEIQKIKNWSEVVKKEWDADTFNDINMKVVLLGSSRVLLEKGLSDSMMGRFEEIRMTTGRIRNAGCVRNKPGTISLFWRISRCSFLD